MMRTDDTSTGAADPSAVDADGAGEALSEIEIEARSQRFKDATGHSPEDYVRLYRDGEIPSTLNNTLSFWDALFLAGHEVA